MCVKQLTRLKEKEVVVFNPAVKTKSPLFGERENSKEKGREKIVRKEREVRERKVKWRERGREGVLNGEIALTNCGSFKMKRKKEEEEERVNSRISI